METRALLRETGSNELPVSALGAVTENAVSQAFSLIELLKTLTKSLLSHSLSLNLTP